MPLEKDRKLEIIGNDPLVAETPVSGLNTWLTPNNLFYIRGHFPFQNIPDDDWRIEINGSVQTPYEINTDELMELSKKTLPTTMECAGNNRKDLDPKVSGNQFDTGAVSTAIWAGASLSEILHKAGILGVTKEILFEGADKGVPEPGKEIISYCRSLPVEDINSDILIAYEMNGEPIPLEHGGPIRLIVPNWYGMASVKWLNKITALEKPFEGYFQTYKYVIKGTGEPDRPVREMKIKSAFSVEKQRASFSSETVSISGFAWSGLGDIKKVEISHDGGKNWLKTNLQEPKSVYSWQHWIIDWIPPQIGSYTFLCKATDTKGNSQPIEPNWNKMGYEINNVNSRPFILEIY
jgi:DMSO/TMAO reductase YedYZ molybdopterin-dependent catalytic subunit